MSIFRNTFTKTVREQLKTRQNALKSRSPKSIIQLNSRNSWVRMTSGVNVNGTSILAKNYILQGGVLLSNKLRFGVGGADKAYSNFAPSLNPYNTSATAGTAGIKPMPGITAIDIKSKSAYGSLREVTVQFECHNLQQLEDLELLYMRPGYTALIEWGWVPFLDNAGQLQSNINFYDDVINGTKEKDQILLDLFQRSKDHSGNYDALYGYIKNYSWTARMDGGYTCTTTIISIGEIMESLKVGWTPLDINNIVSQGGLIKTSPLQIPQSPTTSISQYVAAPKVDFGKIENVLKSLADVGLGFVNNPLAQAYSKNILAGLCYELYNHCQSSPKTSLDIISTNGSGFNMITYFNGPSNLDPGGINAQGNVQAYITLESFVRLLNEYVLLAGGKDQNNRKPFISLSTTSNSYDDNKSEPLLCLAHPLQVSIDPTVCLITNPIWAGGVSTSDINAGANNGTPTTYDSQALDIYNQLEKIGSGDEDPIGTKLLEYIGFGKTEYSPNNVKEFLRSFAKIYRQKNPTTSTTAAINREINRLTNNLVPPGGGSKLGSGDPTWDALFNGNFIEINDKEEVEKTAIADKLAKGDTSDFGNKYLKELGAIEGAKFQTGEEFGIIGNIYLNIDFLYRLSTNDSVKTNGELKLYKYLKTLLNEVQECIGGVNNFDIHVDPVDSVARIIDVNYIDATNRNDAYKNAFPLEMSNTSGTIRSYNIQSQIFPEQASIVAIGAQIGGGGAQASQNNTLLDFNNSLEDRIIPKKFSPITSPNTDEKSTNTEYLKTSLDKLKDFFLPQNDAVQEKTEVTDPNAPISQPSTSEYKGALRDVIRYFQGVTKSNTKNRAIIPIKASITMDGIGGLIIGNLFKIPSDLLPKGYKEGSIGGKLLQTVIGISHKVGSSDWTTTIDAYNIIVNDPKGSIEFKDLISLNPTTGVTTIGASANTVVENLQLSGDHRNRAFAFIASKEQFTEFATNDEGTLRLGYGTDKIFDNGKLRDVRAGDKTTPEAAKQVLISQIQNDYEKRVTSRIGQSNFDKLNDNQKAALISFAYNVGSITSPIATAIKQGKIEEVATLIQNGPRTGQQSGVLKGLILRREQEAALFSTPVSPSSKFQLAPPKSPIKIPFFNPPNTLPF
jgi:GH24 family phage-related lysozyme (muramidase)